MKSTVLFCFLFLSFVSISQTITSSENIKHVTTINGIQDGEVFFSNEEYFLVFSLENRFGKISKYNHQYELLANLELPELKPFSPKYQFRTNFEVFENRIVLLIIGANFRGAEESTMVYIDRNPLKLSKEVSFSENDINFLWNSGFIGNTYGRQEFGVYSIEHRNWKNCEVQLQIFDLEGEMTKSLSMKMPMYYKNFAVSGVHNTDNGCYLFYYDASKESIDSLDYLLIDSTNTVERGALPLVGNINRVNTVFKNLDTLTLIVFEERNSQLCDPSILVSIQLRDIDINSKEVIQTSEQFYDIQFSVLPRARIHGKYSLNKCTGMVVNNNMLIRDIIAKEGELYITMERLGLRGDSDEEYPIQSHWYIFTASFDKSLNLNQYCTMRRSTFSRLNIGDFTLNLREDGTKDIIYYNQNEGVILLDGYENGCFREEKIYDTGGFSMNRVSFINENAIALPTEEKLIIVELDRE